MPDNAVIRHHYTIGNVTFRSKEKLDPKQVEKIERIVHRHLSNASEEIIQHPGVVTSHYRVFEHEYHAEEWTSPIEEEGAT